MWQREWTKKSEACKARRGKEGRYAPWTSSRGRVSSKAAARALRVPTTVLYPGSDTDPTDTDMYSARPTTKVRDKLSEKRSPKESALIEIIGRRSDRPARTSSQQHRSQLPALVWEESAPPSPPPSATQFVPFAS